MHGGGAWRGSFGGGRTEQAEHKKKVKGGIKARTFFAGVDVGGARARGFGRLTEASWVDSACRLDGAAGGPSVARCLSQEAPIKK